MNIIEANNLVTNNSYVFSKETNTSITTTLSLPKVVSNHIVGDLLVCTDFKHIEYYTLFPSKFQEELKGFDMIIETNKDFDLIFGDRNKLVCDSVSTPLLHEFLSEHTTIDVHKPPKKTDTVTVHVLCKLSLGCGDVVSILTGNVKWYVHTDVVPYLARVVNCLFNNQEDRP